MKGRRQLRTPDREISRELYQRLFEKTHRRIHCYMVRGRIVVSREAFEQIRQHATPATDAGPNCFRGLDGTPIYISSYLPHYEKLGSPHRQKWRARCDARQKKKEKMRATLEFDLLVCDADLLAKMFGQNDRAMSRRN